jgi:DNA-directed RNA polymerase subunit RPC12/RpoP
MEKLDEKKLSQVKVKSNVFPKDFFADKKSPEGYVRGLLKYSDGNVGKSIKRLNFYINRGGADVKNKGALKAALKILEKRLEKEKSKKESIMYKSADKFLTERVECLVENEEVFDIQKLTKIAQKSYDEVVNNFDDYSSEKDRASYRVETLGSGAAGIHQAEEIIKAFEIPLEKNDDSVTDEEYLDEFGWEIVEDYFSKVADEVKAKVNLQTTPGYEDYYFWFGNDENDSDYCLFIGVERNVDNLEKNKEGNNVRVEADKGTYDVFVDGAESMNHAELLNAVKHLEGYEYSDKGEAQNAELIDQSLEIEESHDEEKNKYTNFYKCSECGEKWQDVSPYKNNDRCPKCDAEIEPYKSEDIIEEKKLSPAEIEAMKDEDSEVEKIERPKGSLRKKEIHESKTYDEKFLKNSERWLNSDLV